MKISIVKSELPSLGNRSTIFPAESGLVKKIQHQKQKQQQIKEVKIPEKSDNSSSTGIWWRSSRRTFV